MWANHEIVQNSWKIEIRGTKQFILCKKLQGLKVELKKLNEKHFAHTLQESGDGYLGFERDASRLA